MRRVAFSSVLVGLFFVLAGCTGAVPDGTTGTATAETSTPYPDETGYFPPGEKSRPSLPDTVTPASAESYAITHEYRYSYNELSVGGAEVGMSDSSCHVESTEAAQNGYLVVVECSAYVNEPSNGDATRTQHADLPPWRVRYYIDENSVVREELG